MPSVICRNCGKIVRVQGLAAICSQCGQLVTIKEQDVTDLDPQAEPLSAIPIPESQQVPERLKPAIDTKKLVIGIVAGFVVLIFVIDYIRLKLTGPAAPAPVAVAPTPAPAPAPQTPAARPNLFSDDVAPPAPPPPPPTTIPVAAVRKVTPASRPFEALAQLHPRPNTSASRADVTDEQIGDAIKRGVDYLLSQFAQNRIKNSENYNGDFYAGLDALCVNALLHAGQAIDDPRLAITTDLMKGSLDRLREFPMNGGQATYSRSLRVNAMSVYNRNEDKPKMKEDLDWLLNAANAGGYTYTNPEWSNPDAKKRRRNSNSWDNSNSQYGALGVWAAMESGMILPGDFAGYWTEIEKHWIDCQASTGGWGYNTGSASLPMTVAGLNMLFVARQQTSPDAAVPPTSESATAVKNAMEWLEEGDHIIDYRQTGHPGYTLYGIERAGLATGYKYFGEHDWYLSLATKAVANQEKGGLWSGGDGPIAETSFHLLFLSRGRHPIFISKLRFDGNWANRPRDISNLTTFAGKQIERPLNFQIVGLDRSWRDWMDSPILFISSDKAPKFSDVDLDKLRNFALSGGLIFTHADRDSAEFNNYAKDLAKKLFDKELAPLPSDHLIFNVSFPIQNKAALSGVSNGARLLMIHSPTDIAKFWTRRVAANNRWSLELATNIAIYASGKRDFRNRVSSALIAELKDSQPIGAIPVARLVYDGNWNPEPLAWTRFAKQFELDTSIRLDLFETRVESLTPEATPVAHLTGSDAIALNDDQINALRQFIVKGGTLFIDSFGGSKDFTQSVRSVVLPKIFPAGELQALEKGHTLLRGPEQGMRDITEPVVRGYVSEQLGKKIPPLQIMHGGAGQIILSELDVTNALLGGSTWGTMGYTPKYADALMENVIFWTIHQDADYPTTSP